MTKRVARYVQVVIHVSLVWKYIISKYVTYTQKCRPNKLILFSSDCEVYSNPFYFLYDYVSKILSFTKGAESTFLEIEVVSTYNVDFTKYVQHTSIFDF